MSDFPPSRVSGPHYRIISSRYPPIDAFQDLGLTTEERRCAYILECLSNDRLQPASRLAHLPDDEIVSADHGQGANYVMAAFLHTSESGGRFNDASLGSWYSALSVETAISETAFHHHRRLAMSDAGFPNSFDMRVLAGRLDHYLLDLRGRQADHVDLYDPDPERYGPGQRFAAELRRQKSTQGIVYDSVRDAGGTCVCLLWPSAVALPINQERHLRYKFDTSGGFSWMELSAGG